MAVERTFSIIKPDATRRGITGEINAVIEKAGLRIIAQKRVKWTKAQAEEFYGEHKERGFFGELVDFMTSGPVVLLALRGENAVEAVRHMNGATNPANALPGTIRYDFAPNTGENVVHSSDSPESAAREVAYWFKDGNLTDYAPASHVLA